MYEFEFIELEQKLSKAIKYIHKDKASKYVTHIDYDNKEYKVIIEDITKPIKHQADWENAKR